MRRLLCRLGLHHWTLYRPPLMVHPREAPPLWSYREVCLRCSERRTVTYRGDNDGNRLEAQ